MTGRCSTCRGELDDEGRCARCDLEVVELEDAEAGIRREDRWVALPPGPVWVRRRSRGESPIGPFVALAGAIGVLALLVVLAPQGGEPQRAPTPQLLDRPTGAVLYREGPWGVEALDVDAGTIRGVEAIPAHARSGPGTVDDGRHVEPERTATVDGWLFVVTRAGTVEVLHDDGSRYRLPLASRTTDRIAVTDGGSG